MSRENKERLFALEGIAALKVDSLSTRADFHRSWSFIYTIFMYISPGRVPSPPESPAAREDSGKKVSVCLTVDTYNKYVVNQNIGCTVYKEYYRWNGLRKTEQMSSDLRVKTYILSLLEKIYIRMFRIKNIS